MLPSPAETATKRLPVLILYADTPLIQADTLHHLASKIRTGNDICLLGFTTDKPEGYGRIILSKNKMVKAIIEDKDTSEDEQKIRLVNGGAMAAKAGILAKFLPKLKASNSQNELYLTDLVSLVDNADAQIDILVTQEDEVTGVNDRAQLARVEAIMQSRLRTKAINGVTLQAPETVFLSADTNFGTDILIEPNVIIGKGVSIADDCIIRAFSHLEETIIGKGCVVGPYARLRPNTVLEKECKNRQLCRDKNATFEDGSKANHLSYLGDAKIGQKANIGAGTITCNYDGINKFTTTIEDGAFIGSNSALVAPVKIGQGALIGAGSVITKDVDQKCIGHKSFNLKSKLKMVLEHTAKKYQKTATVIK